MKKQSPKVPDRGGSERRSEIIKMVGESIDLSLKDYKEPERKGTVKGEPIGFSLKKMKAACWMMLYPNCFTLKEIAKLAGVSDGVLRVWCHRDDFIEKRYEISRDYGAKTATKIKGSIYEGLIKEFKVMPKTEDDWLQRQTDKGFLLLKSQVTPKFRKKCEAEGKKIIEIDDSPDRWSRDYAVANSDVIHAFIVQLRWFNDELLEPIFEMFLDNMHIDAFVFANCVLAWARECREAVSPYRMRMREIKRLERTKEVFSKTIDMLTDPRERKRMGEARFTEMATALKGAVNATLDILAK